MAVVGAIVSVVSGVVGAVGAMRAAEAQASADNYNASIKDRNAKVAEQNRQITIKSSEVAADDKRRENRRTLASIRSAYGSSGLDLAGSPLDVLADSAAESELDVQRIEYEGKMRAREGALDVLGYNEGATLDRMSAKAAKTAGKFNAASSILGGISSASNSIARMA